MEAEKFDQRFEHWAILEILGHQRFAGRVTEQTVGGAAFVRIDVPASDGGPAFTKLFGSGSIYCITPVAEDIARHLATQLRREPVSVYDLPEEIRDRLRAAPAAVSHVPTEHDDEFEDGEGPGPLQVNLDAFDEFDEFEDGEGPGPLQVNLDAFDEFEVEE